MTNPQKIVSLNANTQVIKVKLTQHQVESLNKNNFVILLLEHEDKDSLKDDYTADDTTIGLRQAHQDDQTSHKNNKGTDMRMNKKLEDLENKLVCTNQEYLQALEKLLLFEKEHSVFPSLYQLNEDLNEDFKKLNIVMTGCYNQDKKLFKIIFLIKKRNHYNC